MHAGALINVHIFEAVNSVVAEQLHFADRSFETRVVLRIGQFLPGREARCGILLQCSLDVFVLQDFPRCGFAG